MKQQETFRSSARNVPSGEERGETDVFASYTNLDELQIRFWFVLLLQIFVPHREIYGFSVSGELTTSVANKENINIGFVLFNSLDQMNRYAKPELIALDMRTWTLNLPFDISHICKISLQFHSGLLTSVYPTFYIPAWKMRRHHNLSLCLIEQI